MVLADFRCEVCEKREEYEIHPSIGPVRGTSTPPLGGQPFCCGQLMVRVWAPFKEFVAERNKATNIQDTANLHTEWLKTPEVKEKLLKGELELGVKPSTPLSEHIECYEVAPPLRGECFEEGASPKQD